MKKVYVVWFDNCEAWEDNVQYIEKIFATREAAEEWLDDCFDRKERLWRNGKDSGMQTYWEEKEEDQYDGWRPEWTIVEFELED